MGCTHTAAFFVPARTINMRGVSQIDAHAKPYRRKAIGCAKRHAIQLHIAHSALLILLTFAPLKSTKVIQLSQVRWDTCVNFFDVPGLPGRYINMAEILQTSAPNYGQKGVATIEQNTRGTIRSVALVIAGQRILIKTDQSEEYMAALAAEVNSLIDELRRNSPGTGLPVLMALASIQLADRALSAEQAVQRENLKVERHIERLSGILKNLESGDHLI